MRAFIDESYTDTRYFIAAALGTEAAWSCVSSALTAIRERTHAEHGTPVDIEFHADELMNGRGNWAPLKTKHREAAGIYAAVLNAAASCGIEVILRGLDIPRLRTRYSYPEQPHGIVLGHTLERVNDRARDHHSGEHVVVVADEISTQAQHIRQFEGYQTWGTPGYRRSLLPYIDAPMAFASSEAVDGLQIADFAVYLHRRRSTHVETHPQAQRSMTRLSMRLDEMVVHDWVWTP